MLSIAYNKGLGRDKNHYLSFGTQIGFTQRTLDISNLAFERQFTGTGFDLQLPSGENIIDALRSQNQTRARFIKANLNIGLLWSANFNKMWGAYVGASMFNIVKPKDTFFKSDNERAFRFNGHAGVLIDINSFVLISPNVMFMTQAKAQQIIGGTSAAFNLSGKREPYKTAVSVGVWYDGNSALISSAGVSFSGLQIAISYDATFKKDLSKAVKSFGALEASIIYTGRPLDKKKQYSPLLCPKF
jgi:type IX secretion system PorP/SprF family membrane protein